MYQQITIKTLHKQGKKKTQIAKEMDCHRNTVRNVINRDGVITKQTRNKSSGLDIYQDQIEKWLKDKVTRRRMYEILVEEYGLDRSYDSLCKYIQKQFPKAPTAYGVQVTNPGEEAEIDFGYVGMQLGNDGKRHKTWVLVVTLSYSRLGFYLPCYDQKIGTLIAGMTAAFEYFGGVPERLKVDNMRTAILKNQHYDLQFNQDFLEFANHHNSVVVPCTPYQPQQKGKVESDVGFVKGNFFCGREFSDRADMEIQLRDWMNTYANRRVHGTTKKIPFEVFNLEEKSKLQALPENPFTFFDRGERLVKKNSHIDYQGNYYSVPSHLVGKRVSIRYNQQILRIVYQTEQVAVHLINSKQGEYITQRSHLPEYKYYSQTEYQQKYESRMADLGQDAAEYFAFLLTTKKGYWSRIARAILGLAKEHGSKVVNLSLKRALAHKATSVTTIKNIIDHQLYLLPIEPQLPKTTLLITQNQDAGEPTNNQVLDSRDLDYYQQALF